MHRWRPGQSSVSVLPRLVSRRLSGETQLHTAGRWRTDTDEMNRETVGYVVVRKAKQDMKKMTCKPSRTLPPAADNWSTPSDEVNNTAMSSNSDIPSRETPTI